MIQELGTWDLRYDFHVIGHPRPQGSHRLARGRLINDNPDLAAWRELVALYAKIAAAGAPALDEPVCVEATFTFLKPPTSKFGEPIGPPDTDKLQRALGDALTDAGMVLDDSRIVSWSASKRWGAEEGVQVRVFVRNKAAA